MHDDNIITITCTRSVYTYTTPCRLIMYLLVENQSIKNALVCQIHYQLLSFPCVLRVHATHCYIHSTYVLVVHRRDTAVKFITCCRDTQSSSSLRYRYGQRTCYIYIYIYIVTSPTNHNIHGYNKPLRIRCCGAKS